MREKSVFGVGRENQGGRIEGEDLTSFGASKTELREKPLEEKGEFLKINHTRKGVFEEKRSLFRESIEWEKSLHALG